MYIGFSDFYYCCDLIFVIFLIADIIEPGLIVFTTFKRYFLLGNLDLLYVGKYTVTLGSVLSSFHIFLAESSG